MGKEKTDPICTREEFEWFKIIHEQFLVRLSHDDSWEFTDEAMDIMDNRWPRMVDIAKSVGIDLADRDTTAVAILEGGVQGHPHDSGRQFPCLKAFEYKKYVYKTQKTFLADFDRLILLLQAQFPNGGVIAIDSKHFSKGKTWDLLKDIVDDAAREGVSCQDGRTLRTLKERLKKAAKDYSQAGYKTLADSLKWKNKRAWTTLPFGKITISPRAQRENKSAHLLGTT